MNFVLTTAPGLEELCRQELLSFGITATIEKSGSALRFEGGFEEAAKVLTRSRLGSRVLLVLRAFSAKDARMLYDQTRRVKWTELFRNYEHTFAVFTHGDTDKTDYNTKFAALKIKDAICDELKKHQGGRPDVNRNSPDLRIEALLYAGRCELSLDLAGEPLHRRGYREDSGEAPLRENRAAALLMFAGYDGKQTLVDPFCGSGTIIIEAALMAQNKAPGLLRSLDSFAGGRIFPELKSALEKERVAAQKEVQSRKTSIFASDISAKAVSEARANLGRAGCSHLVSIDQADAKSLSRSGALVVSNPPYGERMLEGDAEKLLSDFVRQVKHHCSPTTMALVLPATELENSVGLKPEKQLQLASGDMTLKFLKYEVFSGRLAERKKILVSPTLMPPKKKTAKKTIRAKT